MGSRSQDHMLRKASRLHNKRQPTLDFLFEPRVFASSGSPFRFFDIESIMVVVDGVAMWKR